MISHRQLPRALTAPLLDVLSQISTSERDLIRVIVDVVTELRSSYTENKEDEEVISCSSYVFRGIAKWIVSRRWQTVTGRKDPKKILRARLERHCSLWMTRKLDIRLQ